jgi:sialic acid synthase SpsE
LQGIIDAVKIVRQARDGKKCPVEAEKETIAFAYASVVSIKAIKKGELFTPDNTWVKRPGTGKILAEDYDFVLGKKSSKDIKKDIQISWNDIERDK